MAVQFADLSLHEKQQKYFGVTKSEVFPCITVHGIVAVLVDLAN